MTKVAFNNTNNSFSIELRKKINEYFSKNKIRTTGNTQLYIKTAIIAIVGIATYITLVFYTPPVWISIALCCLLGFNLAAVGFNVMHDGAHGSYSNKKWINDIMANSLNLMGGTSFLWKIKHNVIHHTFTNVEGHDDDIDIKPMMRTNENQKRYWFHRYQHIYWVLLYSITYLFWVFFADFKKYFTRKVADHEIKEIKLKEHIIFWVTKLVYVFLFLVLPAMQVGITYTIVGYLITAMVCGFVISVVFQLAHIVTETEFPTAEPSTGVIDNEWTIHQLATTANFSTKSKLVSWFVGGLNFQVEHHLFPRISHAHYPALNELLKEVCAKYNVNYIEYPSVLSALRSHVVHLKRVGRN